MNELEAVPPETPRLERLSADDIKGRPCSIAGALAVVGDRWSLLAVREVLFGNHRFSEIARNTGAPRDRLAARLKVLVEAGVLERKRYQDNPARWSYHLTESGRALSPVLHALRKWGDDYVMDTPPVTMMHGGHEIEAEWVCRTCHEPLLNQHIERRVNATNWDLAGPLVGSAADRVKPS